MGFIALAVVLTTLAPVGVEDPPGLPANVTGGPFQSTLEIMWRASPTFRQQCSRIAAQPNLAVHLRSEPARGPALLRARTELSRRDGVLILAEVVIVDLRGQIELIGHEVEHVIEQLEGLELRETTCDAHEYRTSAHESCRAIEAGRRIAHEVEEQRRRDGRRQWRAEASGVG